MKLYPAGGVLPHTLLVCVAAFASVDGLAADIIVTSFEDVIDDADGTCTLREAVRSANDDVVVDACAQGAGEDRILLAAGTYTLDLVNRTGEDAALDGDLDLIGPLEIRGVSPAHTVIDGVTGQSLERVIDVVASQEPVVVRGLRVTGGTDEGGGNILNESDAAPFGLELIDVLVDDGEAGVGGGIAIDGGSARLKRATVSGNSADDGGGIWVLNGSLELLDSSVTDNSAGIDGAGVHTAGSGITRIHRSRIAGNTTEIGQTRGGGIFYAADELDMQFTTVEGNQAERGGGLFIANVMANVVHSALIGNSADLQGGGLFAEADSFVRHSTLAENIAPEGGAAYVNSTMILFDSVTIAGNAGGGVFNENGALFEFSLLADNADGNCLGTAPTAGNLNLDDGNTCLFPPDDPNDPAFENLVNTDPMLGSLTDNGGPTLTFALLPGSPAIDAVSSEVRMNCENNPDQRGYPRGYPPQIPDMLAVFFCDIGAFEPHAPYVVDSTADEVDLTSKDGICATANGECTLRAAIQQANATVGLEEIVVPAGQYVLTIPGGSDDAGAEGDLDINDALIVRGAGPEATVVDAGGLDRVFDINSGSIFQVDAGQLSREPRVLADLAIINGVDDFGGGIDAEEGLHLERVHVASNLASSQGGGIYCDADCRIEDSTILDNETQGKGGGVSHVGDGNLTVLRSSVLNNHANEGGGIEVQRAFLQNVTVSGNSDVDAAGGIHVLGSIVLNNVTTVRNASDQGIGGIQITLPSVIGSTILAENTTAATLNNCGVAPSILVSANHNLANSDASDCSFFDSDDLLDADPLMGPLADNGGLTQTHALLPGSPAIDAGDDENCPATDQRGFLRPDDGDGDGNATCDVGAYEVLGADLVLTISDSPDPVVVDNDVTYTVTITNNGPGPASGVAASASVPTGLSFVSADAGVATCSESAGSVDCDLGDIAAGDSLQIQIVATAGQSGSVSVSATVSAAEADPMPADNTVTESTTVNAAGAGGGAIGGSGGGGGGALGLLWLLALLSSVWRSPGSGAVRISRRAIWP